MTLILSAIHLALAFMCCIGAWEAHSARDWPIVGLYAAGVSAFLATLAHFCGWLQ